MIVRQDIPKQFLREACEIVMSKRMQPFDKLKLEQCQLQLERVLQQRNHEPSLYLEVSVQLRGKLERVKIEQWCFTVVSARERTIQGLVSIESSDELEQPNRKTEEERPPLSQLVRMISSKNISPNSFEERVLSTDFLMTFQRQQLCALDVENTFEVVIDSFESRLHSFAINLMYNYEVEEEQEDFVEIIPEEIANKKHALTDRIRQLPKHVATEVPQQTKEPTTRKYSEGLEAIPTHSFSKKVNVDLAKLQAIRNRLAEVQFSRIDPRTPQEMLNWVLE